MNSSSEMKQLIIQNIRNDIISRNPIFINLALQCVSNIGDAEMAVAFTTDIPRLLISGLVEEEERVVDPCHSFHLEIRSIL